MVHYQNVGQNYNAEVGNKYFENVAKFKYLEATLTNQNYIHKEDSSRSKFGKCLPTLTSGSFAFLSM
jgi:hypothetical protein